MVIQELDSKKQTFLHGHTNNVSCLVVSRNGVYVASGQVTFMGFKVDNALFFKLCNIDQRNRSWLASSGNTFRLFFLLLENECLQWEDVAENGKLWLFHCWMCLYVFIKY